MTIPNDYGMRRARPAKVAKQHKTEASGILAGGVFLDKIYSTYQTHIQLHKINIGSHFYYHNFDEITQKIEISDTLNWHLSSSDLDFHSI